MDSITDYHKQQYEQHVITCIGLWCDIISHEIKEGDLVIALVPDFVEITDTIQSCQYKNNETYVWHESHARMWINDVLRDHTIIICGKNEDGHDVPVSYSWLTPKIESILNYFNISPTLNDVTF